MFDKSWVFVIGLLAWACPAFAQLGDEWIGQRVVTKFAQPIRVDNRTIDNGTAFRIYLVEKHDEGILTIASGNVRGWIWASDVVPFDKAVEFYTSELAINPQNSAAYNWRGLIERERGNLDKAIADFTEATKRTGDGAHPYNSRGSTLLLKGEIDKAIDDFNEALRIDPKHYMALFNRGDAWKRKGDVEKALADFAAAIAINSRFALARNERAWLRATCADASRRDGKAAVEDALVAVDATSGMNAAYLDRRAAAYAEAGLFEMAVQTETRALNLLNKLNRNMKELQARLELYRAGKPYHEPPAKKPR